MSGLSLRTASAYFRGDQFSGWNPDTDTFEDPFTGRLMIIDRFKSIYNKPTRRQKLTFPSDVQMPASYVVMREQDGEIFLVSHLLEREFWKGGDNYDNVATLHRVNSLYGGKGAFYPARTSGTDDDLGFVEVPEEAPIYIDLEYKSSSREEGSLDVDTNINIVTYSGNVEAEPGDYFYLAGKFHRIANVYVDSGLHSARVFQEEPSYVEVLYEMQEDGSPVYDPATGTATSNVTYDPMTGTYVPGDAEYREVSCLIGDHQQRRDLYAGRMANTLTLFIYKRHIGFDPELGDKLTVKGTKYRVEEISYSTLELQWKLMVSV